MGSAIIVTFRLIEFGLHYADVSSETKELLKNVELVDRKINSARYLRRVKSGWLDSRMKEEVERDIEIAQEIVTSIARTIERCRKDLVAENRVTAINRLRWIFRDNEAFLSKERTLSNSLIALTSDIGQMTTINVAEPPSYESATRFRGPLRGPTVRRQIAKQKSNASLATLDHAEAAHNASTPSLHTVHTHDGHLSTPNITQYSDWTDISAAASITPVHTHDGHLSTPDIPETSLWDDTPAPRNTNPFGTHTTHSASSLPSFAEGIWKPTSDYDLGEDEKKVPGAYVYELDGGGTGLFASLPPPSLPPPPPPTMSTMEPVPRTKRRLRCAGIS